MRPRRNYLLACASFAFAASGCGTEDLEALDDDGVENAASALDVLPIVSHSATTMFITPGGRTVVELRGKGFGVPKQGSNVKVKFGPNASFTSINSTNTSKIRFWTDTHILVVFDSTKVFTVGSTAVHTPAGTGPTVPLEVYDLDTYFIPLTKESNSMPIALSTDAAGRVFINEEYNTHAFAMYSPTTNTVSRVQVPYPAGPGPFAGGGATQTQTSFMGEDTLIDPKGRVWFSLSGAYMYKGTAPNHSRLVSYDPANGSFKIYNLPGDQNEAWGMAWDAPRNRMWVTHNATLGRPAKLVSFNPDNIPYDNTFDFSTSLDHQICSGSGSDANCYHEYPLPSKNYMVPHVAVDSAGYVWYTSFWGTGDPATGKNEIGRLNPSTGQITQFPLATPLATEGPAFYAGSGAWSIVLAPNGDVLFNEYFDNTLARFKGSMLSNPACLSLVNGKNPCIAEYTPPNLDLTVQTIHSATLDASNHLWFTQADSGNLKLQSSIGYLTPTNKVVTLPPIGLFPANKPFSGTGIVVDKNGDKWFGDYWNRRLMRVHRY